MTPDATPDPRPLIVVLGASGLLGTAVARVLADRPVRLRLVGRRPTGVPPGGRAEVEVRTVDLTGEGALAAAVDGADAVLHLVIHSAGPGTWRVADGDTAAERINVGLLTSLIEHFRRRPPARPPVVIFAGSMSQAGRAASGRIDGTERDEPLTVYDRQKLAAEQALEAATAQGLVRGITLRLATLFSRGSDPSHLDRGVVAAMARRALAGQPLTMWHDGTVTRDLLCVDDAAAAFAAALDHAGALTGHHWLVGSGQATSIADLFTAIAKAAAAHTGRPPVPVVSVAPAPHSVPSDLVDFVLDPTRFRSVTGWEIQVPLSDAIEQAVVAIAGEQKSR